MNQGTSDSPDNQLHLEETLDHIYQMRNFNRWIYSLIKPYLGTRIVEIGCGVGSFTELLLEQDRQVYATDIEPAYLDRLQKRFKNNSRVRVTEYDLSQSPTSALLSGEIDTVVCMNVIEHIEDDEQAFRHLSQLLCPGGRSVVLVPAFQWLYGSIDVSYRHFRRYHRNRLEQLSRKSGIEVERTFYVNLAGIPGWWVAGKLFKRKVLPSGGLQLYHQLVPVFKFLEKISGPPIGLSLISIGRKPEKNSGNPS